MDPATFILKDENGEDIKAMSAAHVDDTISIADESKSE